MILSSPSSALADRQAGAGGGGQAGGGGVPFIGAQAKDPLISESQNPSFQLYGFY